MIIIRVAGGLGNQMQQYALYRKLQSLGKEVKLDLSWFDRSVQETMLAPRALELRRFIDLPLEVADKKEVARLTGGQGLGGRIARKLGLARTFEESRMYHPEIFSMDDVYLMGYFACNKYYADILPALREAFIFPPAADAAGDNRRSGQSAGSGDAAKPEQTAPQSQTPRIRQDGADRQSTENESATRKSAEQETAENERPTRKTAPLDSTRQERNARIMREMEAPEVFSVAIHIRRGDYLDSANADILGGICTPAYYEGAVRFLAELESVERIGSAADACRLHFYVFSDDPDFARAQSYGTGKEPVTVCDWNTGEDNMLDMQLMSHCRALIAANSTFSFWGGRLNGRRDKILIRPLYHRNNQKPDPALMQELWEGWTLIDRDGRKVYHGNDAG